MLRFHFLSVKAVISISSVVKKLENDPMHFMVNEKAWSKSCQAKSEATQLRESDEKVERDQTQSFSLWSDLIDGSDTASTVSTDSDRVRYVLATDKNARDSLTEAAVTEHTNATSKSNDQVIRSTNDIMVDSELRKVAIKRQIAYAKFVSEKLTNAPAVPHKTTSKFTSTWKMSREDIKSMRKDVNHPLASFAKNISDAFGISPQLAMDVLNEERSKFARMMRQGEIYGFEKDAETQNYEAFSRSHRVVMVLTFRVAESVVESRKHKHIWYTVSTNHEDQSTVLGVRCAEGVGQMLHQGGVQEGFRFIDVDVNDPRKVFRGRVVNDLKERKFYDIQGSYEGQYAQNPPMKEIYEILSENEQTKKKLVRRHIPHVKLSDDDFKAVAVQDISDILNTKKKNKAKHPLCCCARCTSLLHGINREIRKSSKGKNILIITSQFEEDKTKLATLEFKLLGMKNAARSRQLDDFIKNSVEQLKSELLNALGSVNPQAMERVVRSFQHIYTEFDLIPIKGTVEKDQESRDRIVGLFIEKLEKTIENMTQYQDSGNPTVLQKQFGPGVVGPEDLDFDLAVVEFADEAQEKNSFAAGTSYFQGGFAANNLCACLSAMTNAQHKLGDHALLRNEAKSVTRLSVTEGIAGGPCQGECPTCGETWRKMAEDNTVFHGSTTISKDFQYLIRPKSDGPKKVIEQNNLDQIFQQVGARESDEKLKTHLSLTLIAINQIKGMLSGGIVIEETDPEAELPAELTKLQQEEKEKFQAVNKKVKKQLNKNAKHELICLREKKSSIVELQRQRMATVEATEGFFDEEALEEMFGDRTVGFKRQKGTLILNSVEENTWASDFTNLKDFIGWRFAKVNSQTVRDTHEFDQVLQSLKRGDRVVFTLLAPEGNLADVTMEDALHIEEIKNIQDFKHVDAKNTPVPFSSRVDMATSAWHYGDDFGSITFYTKSFNQEDAAQSGDRSAALNGQVMMQWGPEFNSTRVIIRTKAGKIISQGNMTGVEKDKKYYVITDHHDQKTFLIPYDSWTYAKLSTLVIQDFYPEDKKPVSYSPWAWDYLTANKFFEGVSIYRPATPGSHILKKCMASSYVPSSENVVGPDEGNSIGYRFQDWITRTFSSAGRDDRNEINFGPGFHDRWPFVDFELAVIKYKDPRDQDPKKLKFRYEVGAPYRQGGRAVNGQCACISAYERTQLRLNQPCSQKNVQSITRFVVSHGSEVAQPSLCPVCVEIMGQIKESNPDFKQLVVAKNID